MPSQSNEMFRPKAKLTKESLLELTSSVSTLGVIQPIAIRPDALNPGHYILIAGERRYHASIFAGKKTIPAKIWDVSEDVAFNMQITENLHREDIHAVNEAKAYKMILDTSPTMNTKELSLKFGKSETYVVQRLKLLDLVDDAAKIFLANKIMLGHALLLSRLTEADQKVALGNMKQSRGDYGTVQQLQDFIERSVVNDLSKAPFDRKDVSLCPKAGPCVLCPKRSGASLLFADVKGKDKCFDRTCYQKKEQVHLLNEVKRVVESSPETPFLATRYGGVPDAVLKIMTDQQIKPLIEYDDFNTYKSDKAKKVNGMWISGERTGMVGTVYIRPNAEKKVEPNNPETIRKNVAQRMKRFRELDEEKVYAKILVSMKEHPSQKKPESKLLKVEETFLWYLVWDKAGLSLSRELAKKLHIPMDTPEKIGEAMANLKAEDKAYLLRRVMMDQYGGNYPRSAYGTIIRQVAEAYGDIDVKGFETEQKEICDKREARAKEKLKKLSVSSRQGHAPKKVKKVKKTKRNNVAA